MDQLNRLAKQVDEEFSDVAVVIDNLDRRTLIAHTASESQASKVESFLNDRGARTTRETYDEDDIRVLAVQD